MLMRILQPTQIIILGGGGDLAQRKLLPALFDLYTKNLLPETFRIIGLARSDRSNDAYRQLAKEAIHKHTKSAGTSLDTFCEHIEYISGAFDENASYKKLQSLIEEYDKEIGHPTNRLFYLAVHPSHYSDIFKNFSENSLSLKDTPRECWSRLLIEKPFGSDYASAVALDKELLAVFDEDQIFRIDHYLAKEAVQNILSFRFANTLIRSVWNKEHIAQVNITMRESINVESRGSFYDAVGALRDVGQNHLLQILALITMEEPETFTSEHIRQNRASVLEKLTLFDDARIHDSVVRAQYEGFTETNGVDTNSTTETYFEFKVSIEDEQWSNVPFYISAGKALKNDEAIIEIIFKDVNTGPFKMSGNAIILTISPVQSMNITLNVKKPRHGYHIQPHTLSFAWDEENRGIVNAYEKVLLDCIEGDRTLFTTTREVLASWKFINSITNRWGVIPLQRYQQGTDGPEHTLHSKT